MKKFLRVMAVLALLAILLVGAAVWWSRGWLQTPIATLRESTVFEIPRGASLRTVASDLQQRGLLDQPEIWITWARIMRRAGDLKAGEYALQPGLTPQQLLDVLSSGAVVLHSVTFIEGSTFADVRKLLRTNTAVRGDYADKSAEEIMQALGVPGVHPEGQFFPDTYHFPRGSTDLELLAMAHRRMTTELDAAWKDRDPALPLASSYEALILASVVEKETALDRERPLVAGVFVERLRRGMRLQTDPTVIYGIGEAYDGNIRRADLLRDTPYNTYTRTGLPPTPIALPGLDSLRAAVKPTMSGAIFFVATGEPDGSHFFSGTLKEHEAAVRRYLQKIRRRTR
ncbi:MAG: endolytic transglycosylase MltG [Steroidobacteraceae bacterium]